MGNPDYYNDKICIVTGGNSGIGYAICEGLLKRGSIVYMLGRNPKKVSYAAQKLSNYKDRIHTLIADVTNPEQVENAVNDTVKESGRLDFLFNNAGVGGTMPFEKATLEDWRTIIDVNLWSVIYGVTAAIPIMLNQGSGHIVNTSSFAGIVPPPFQSLYSVTKFGVTGLTESLRYEFAEKGLYFSTICPVNIATPIFKKDIQGKINNELKIPEDAYPVDKAANIILERVIEKKGIIVVPEEYDEFWKAYVLGKAEDILLQMADERRELFG